MPTILTNVSIAANSVNQNIIQGSSFEFARGAGLVSIGIGAEASGVVTNISAGAEQVAEAFDTPVLARYPILPDEMYFAAQLAAGDRLVIRSQNTTAAAIIAKAVTQLSFQG